MRLTGRDIQMLLKVNECQWLSTSQIKRYFFALTTNRAVNKRMKVLVDEGYLCCGRTSSTEDYFFRISQKAKSLLVEHGLDADSIHVPHRLPVQLKHFAAINDLRWHAEQSIRKHQGVLEFFFADRELKGVLGASPVIPDALLGFKLNREHLVQQHVVALEYDAAAENPQYFGRDKVSKYISAIERRDGVFATPDLRVVVFADSRKRIVQLIRHSIKFLNGRSMFLFGSLEDLEREGDLFAPIFIDPARVGGSERERLVSLVE